MNFSEALIHLNNGCFIKAPEWGGYWFKEAGMIKVKTNEGDILETPHFQQYIFREDWIVLDPTTMEPLIIGSKQSKTLVNTDANGATKNVKDIVFWGNGDTFKLISKASSQNEGWMKSTKAMEIESVGCVVQVTTQQGENVSEAVTFVPNVKILEEKDDTGTVVSRKLVDLYTN